MECTVVFKWVRDPETARVGADGSVDWGRAQPAAGDDDPAAIEIAKSLSGEDDITAVTIAGGDVAWAAARGAKSTFIIADAIDLDSSDLASVLAKAVQVLGDKEVILIGDSAWNRSVPVAMAAHLGLPCIAQVESASDNGDGTLHILRKTAGGEEALTVRTPVVLAAAAHAEEKRAPGMKEVLAARKAPQIKSTMAELGAQAVAKVASQGTRLPDTVAVQLFEGDQAAAQLVEALRFEGVL